jgi:hypothetical protein
VALGSWNLGWNCSKVCWPLGIQHLPGQPLLIFEEFGTATHPPSLLHGQPCSITFAVLTAVKQLYEQHPDTYLDELQWFLAIHHDIIISILALQVNVNNAGSHGRSFIK